MPSVPEFEIRPEGRIVSGRVFDGSGPDAVLFRFEWEGVTCQARVPAREFRAPPGPDQELPLFIDQADGEGYTASVDKAHRLSQLERLEQAHKEKQAVEGEVVALVKGGYAVDVGLRAFLPSSQIALRPLKVPEEALGQVLAFRVLRFHRSQAKVVLSRRPLLEVDRDRLAEQVRAGAIVEGTVREVVPNGAWVDVQGMDGFLPLADMTWGKERDPHQLVSEGQDLRLKVLKVDKNRGRLGLGLRQLQDDPWNTADTRYPAGTQVKGMVVSKTDVGCFVEFEPGLEGLIFSTGPLATASVQRTLAKTDIGDELSAAVVEVNLVSRRIILKLDESES